MRMLKQPGEDLDRPSLRACPRLGCVAAPSLPAGFLPPSYGSSPRVHSELTGRSQDWLVYWWPLVWFCFLFSVDAPSCSLLSPPTGSRGNLSSRPGEWLASLLPPRAALAFVSGR